MDAALPAAMAQAVAEEDKPSEAACARARQAAGAHDFERCRPREADRVYDVGRFGRRADDRWPAAGSQSSPNASLKSGSGVPSLRTPCGRAESGGRGEAGDPLRAAVVTRPAAVGRDAMPDGEAQIRFRALMLPHLDAAYNLARYLTRKGDAAQDLVQEAFVRALKGFGHYRGENAKAWLLTIVRNCFLTQKGKGPARTVSLEDYLFPGRDPGAAAPDLWDPDQETAETALIRRDDQREIRELLEALPPAFREMLVLRELEELSYKEIAAVTDTPIGTVMSRLARARQMLAAAWTRRQAGGREQAI